MLQAKNTERKWFRLLQHENSLRLQLQENIEMLANQMHGLEDEARQSVQGILPSLHTVTSRSSSKIRRKKKVTLPNSLDKEMVGDHQSSDGEDEFFDAPEASVEDLKKSNAECDHVLEGLSVGHRRSVSTASVNDSTSMHCSSESSIKEKLPQISSDRKLTVSTVFHFLLVRNLLLYIRYTLIPLPTFLRTFLKPWLNGEALFLQNPAISLTSGQ